MTGNLSLNQEFLCSLDHGDAAGAFSQWYTITYGLRLRGSLDVGALSAALDDVVARHEMLRTSLRKDGDKWRQHLHEPGQVTLEVRDASDAHALLDDVEAEPFSPAQVPLLRAVLGRLGAGDHVLALNTHHVASDAWSMQVIIRDLAACYAARADGRRPDPPPAVQYREFTAWQRAHEESWSGAADRWRDRLAGARVHALPADRALPAGAADPYSVHKFVIGRELTEAAARVARSARSSLFVVLLAAYNLLASQLTEETALSGEARGSTALSGEALGSTDLVVPTFTAGRNEPRFAGVVGPLYNFLPIRTDLGGCGSFADVIARTRASCLQAYANDIPFPLIAAQAPDLMAPCGDDHLAVCAFEMLPPSDLTGIERAGDVRYSELRDRRTSRPVGASTPKGMLWALDHLRSGELVGVIRFGRDRFDEGTIARISNGYRQVLSASIAEPTARLARS